jgi:prepilin-type N-terminal cleavage/methylation domain-containing protein
MLTLTNFVQTVINMTSYCKIKNRSFRGRSAFTLVEMMFVIAIIAVLSSLAVAVLQDAQDDARVAATKSRITQIEAIMQTVMEDYEVRRLPIRNNVIAAYVTNSGTHSISDSDFRLRVKNLRRRLLAMLISAEFPTAEVDSMTGEFQVNESIDPSDGESGLLGDIDVAPVDTLGLGLPHIRTWVTNTYGSDVHDAIDGITTADIQYWRDVSTWPASQKPVEPGEFLYLILQRLHVDGSTALELLGPNAVGNPDGDDAPDIVDAFGDSMQLRIVQVAVSAAPLGGSDAGWIDQTNVNWQQSYEIGNGIKVPVGYQIYNPVIPRPVRQLRFQVVSPRLESRE